MNNKFALYIHIPFCISKCSYCDFCSFVPKNTQMQDYVEALINEIEQTSKIYAGQVTSVYIGGGTPSVLPLGAITRIMSAVKSNFNLQPNISITIEANPNSFDILKAQEYASAGCNRLSLGLQSHKPEILKVLNRVHNLQDFKNAVNNAVKVGITNINADVMLGVPNQSLDDLSETLKVLVDLPISHISAYGLICEPNTPLTKQIECQQLTLPSEDDTVQMYDFAVEFLKKYGFNRYEISNFAKTGFKSKYITTYAYILTEAGSPYDAIPVLEKAMEYNPVDCGPKLELAEVYKRLKNKKRLIEITAETLRVASSPQTIARCYANMGYMLTDFGEYDDAVAFYTASAMADAHPAIPLEMQHLADLKGSPIQYVGREKINEVFEKYDLTFGPNQEVVNVAAQLGAYYLGQKNIKYALNAMKITYGLTRDQELRKIILKYEGVVFPERTQKPDITQTVNENPEE